MKLVDKLPHRKLEDSRHGPRRRSSIGRSQSNKNVCSATNDVTGFGIIERSPIIGALSPDRK